MHLKQSVWCSDETLAVIIGRGIVHLIPCAFSCYGANLFSLNILNNIHVGWRCGQDPTIYDPARCVVTSTPSSRLHSVPTSTTLACIVHHGIHHLRVCASIFGWGVGQCEFRALSTAGAAVRHSTIFWGVLGSFRCSMAC